MVKIGRCTSCGTYFSEAWKARDNCGECGGAIDHLEEKMGRMELYPRVMNLVGIVLLLFGLLLFLLDPGKIDDTSGRIAMVSLPAVSAIMFLLSLLFQTNLVKKAIERRKGKEIKPRRIKGTQTSGNNEVRKGPLGRERKVARKIR